MDEPAADLAIALAVASSLRDKPTPPTLVAFGELGLAGEVRSVPRAKERMAEAEGMGFSRAVVPVAQVPAQTEKGRRGPTSLGIGVKNIVEALAVLG